MARPLRIEFAGALYHITSRGDRREAIFDDDADCRTFLEVNPVRAGIVKSPEQWPWSSYRAMIGEAVMPKRMQHRGQIRGDVLTVPQAQRRSPAPSLEDIAVRYPERNAAMVAAYSTGAYSYREIATHFGVHLAWRQ